MKLIRLRALLLFLVVTGGPVYAVSEGDTTQINVSGTIVESSACTINAATGNKIEVFFGDDVYIDKINGSDYKRTLIPIKLDCSNSAGLTMSLKINASGVGEGCNKYLCTDHEGLALKLFKDKTIDLNVGKELSFVVGKNGVATLPPSIYASPIITGAQKPKAGRFLSAATVVIDIK